MRTILQNWALVLMLSLPLNLFAQQGTGFSIVGRAGTEPQGWVYLSYPDAAGNFQRDSSLIRQGGFSFSGQIAHPVLAFLRHSWLPGSEQRIWLEPVKMEMQFGEKAAFASLKGSATQLEYEHLQAERAKLERRWKIVLDTLNEVNKRSNTAFQELKNWVLVPYFEEAAEIEYRFYDQHPASIITAFQLQITGRDLSTDSLKLFYDRLSPLARNSRYGKKIALDLEARRRGIPGTMAEDFTRLDIKGNQLKLSGLRGKYVLLDFWGSWCVPCRKGHPHLRQLYAKYQQRGIEFVGIAADDNNPAAWRKAVETDQLPWLQVLEGDQPNDDIGKQYNIEYYPTKILIDPKGKIIGRFGEDTAALEKALSELFD